MIILRYVCAMACVRCRERTGPSAAYWRTVRDQRERCWHLRYARVRIGPASCETLAALEVGPFMDLASTFVGRCSAERAGAAQLQDFGRKAGKF